MHSGFCGPPGRALEFRNALEQGSLSPIGRWARCFACSLTVAERIGNGGALIARDLGHLHGDTVDEARLGNMVTKNNALNEKGEQINGVGATPNQHDILTGSQADGRAYTDSADHTCKNWTSNAADGVAQVGHSDRNGGGISWNAVHPSRGCGQANLAATGGARLS